MTKYRTWFKRWSSETLLHGALFALLFFIPLSSSLKSIALVVSIGLLLFLKLNQSSLRYILRQPWVWFIIALFSIVVISCLWSPAPWAEQAFVVEKYSKLLWLPLLMLGFTEAKTRDIGLHVFIASMLVTALVAFAIELGWVHSILPSGSVFRNHIITGHMMSFACYLVGNFAIKNREKRWIYLSLFVIFSYEVLFISQGRTGYVIYFVLMALLMLQLFKKWHLLVAFGVLCLFGAFTYHYSSIMQERVDWIYKDVKGIQQGHKDSSLGFRYQFQKFAYALFKESPVIGHGSGALTYYFDERQPIPAWGKQLREPHNQYWLIAAEYGVVGMILYLGLLVSLGLACLRLKKMQPLGIALLIPFIIGNFSDSLLFYSGCGYFFLTLMALCLGEGIGRINNSNAIPLK